MNQAGPLNATPLYRLSPASLLFGMWDSTGPKGGLGAKFERAIVSEVAGIGASLSDDHKNRGVRRDPLQASRAVPILKNEDGLWRVYRTRAVKKITVDIGPVLGHPFRACQLPLVTLKLLLCPPTPIALLLVLVMPI